MPTREVNRFLDEFLTARIGTDILSSQYLSITRHRTDFYWHFVGRKEASARSELVNEYIYIYTIYTVYVIRNCKSAKC